MLIAIAFAGVLLTLGRFSLDSTAGNKPVAPLAFPARVPLPGWQLLESRPLAKPTAGAHKSWEAVPASYKYRYRQGNQQLEIEMRYVVSTSGELQGYFGRYNSVQLQDGQLLQSLRQHEGVGFYSLFVHQGRSHLSACINPQGGSTVTREQFIANRFAYDFQLQHLVPWLLGQVSLPDKRCLWVDLFMPLNQMSAESTYPVLEKAWRSWYQWWSSRFPRY